MRRDRAQPQFPGGILLHADAACNPVTAPAAPRPAGDRPGSVKPAGDEEVRTKSDVPPGAQQGIRPACFIGHFEYGKGGEERYESPSLGGASRKRQITAVLS